MLPDDGKEKPAIAFSKVDLPQPEDQADKQTALQEFPD
jgi:hypothetical protein